MNDINFPSKKVNSAEVIIKGQGMPLANEVKYLGITYPPCKAQLKEDIIKNKENIKCIGCWDRIASSSLIPSY